MATGVYDVVRAVNQMRTTNELVCASLALDLDYMEQLLSARPGKFGNLSVMIDFLLDINNFSNY